MNEHPCIVHNKRFPDNPLNCRGVRCSDCPFEVEFKKRDEKEKEEYRRKNKNVL